MLILLDIGNTAVSYGLYAKGRLSHTGSCLHGEILAQMSRWMRIREKQPWPVVASSVVPAVTKTLKKWALRHKDVRLWVAGKNLPVPLKHKYDDIRKLGIDRAVNIYGALKIYRPPFLVLDYGTALTVDFVNKSGVFEGGLIIPGPETALRALVEKGALLPKKLAFPQKTPGLVSRNTKDCLSAGIIESYGAMADELIQRFRDRYGYDFRVLVTGGYARFIRPLAHGFQILDPHLSLTSLLILYKSSPQR